MSKTHCASDVAAGELQRRALSSLLYCRYLDKQSSYIPDQSTHTTRAVHTRPRPPARRDPRFRADSDVRHSRAGIRKFEYARATPFTRHVAVHQGGKNAPELLGRSAAVRRVASWLVAPRLDRLETPGAPALGPAFDRIANWHASPGAILHATRASGHPAYNASPRLSCMHTTHCRVPRRLFLASDDL